MIYFLLYMASLFVVFVDFYVDLHAGLAFMYKSEEKMRNM